MNRFTTRTGAAVIAVATATSVAACSGGSGGSSSASASDTLTVAVDADAAPNGYDPLLYSQGQYTFFSTMYDALFVTDKDGKAQPNLATKFSNSPDNLKTTLTLRDGVTFADGKKLDSTVVKANLDRRTDPDLEAYGQIGKGQASEITDVTASDPQTVVITWKAPQATPENNLADTAGVIIGPDGVANPDSLETEPDGSGPYTLDEAKSTRASSYTMDKNAKAWNADAWSFDHVVYKVITDPQALANAVISGQADVAGILNPTTIDQVESKQKTVKIGGTIVGFPVTDKTGKASPAFGNEKARQALLYATDRTSLVDQLHQGSRATSQLFPEGATGFDAGLDDEFGYDPEKAKQLLAEAGYPNGFDVGLTVLGQPNEDAVAIQSQWKKVGINLKFVTATSTDQVFAAVNTDPVIFGPFTVGSNPAGFVAGALYGGFMNQQGAKEPAIDASLGAALGAKGDAQKQALTDLNRAITEHAWYVPVYEDFTYYGYNAGKVAAPVFAGTNNYLVLSEIKPAS